MRMLAPVVGLVEAAIGAVALEGPLDSPHAVAAEGRLAWTEVHDDRAGLSLLFDTDIGALSLDAPQSPQALKVALVRQGHEITPLHAALKGNQFIVIQHGSHAVNNADAGQVEFG